MPDTLRPFADRGRCPMCSDTRTELRYCSGCGGASEAHLHCRCDGCGFAWAMHTREATLEAGATLEALGEAKSDPLDRFRETMEQIMQGLGGGSALGGYAAPMAVAPPLPAGAQPLPLPSDDDDDGDLEPFTAVGHAPSALLEKYLGQARAREAKWHAEGKLPPAPEETE